MRPISAVNSTADSGMRERGAVSPPPQLNPHSSNSPSFAARVRTVSDRHADESRDTAGVSSSASASEGEFVPLCGALSTALTSSDWVHCAGMVALYTCQGLVQATTFLLPLSFLHINKGFSKESIGLLGLSSYAFAFKFLWAPIVDLVWSGGLERLSCGMAHRRVQWVVGLQLCLMGCVAYLRYLSTLPSLSSSTLGDRSSAASGDLTVTRGPTYWADIASNTVGIGPIACVLYAIVLCSTTLDVALDAWCIEGCATMALGAGGMDGKDGKSPTPSPSPATINTRKAKFVGYAQYMGITLGMVGYSLFSKLHTNDALRWPMALFFDTAVSIAATSIVIALLMGVFVPLGQKEKGLTPAGSRGKEGDTLDSTKEVPTKRAAGSSALLARDVMSFLRSPTVWNIVRYLLSRGFLESSNELIGVEMMSLGWTSTANTATVSLVSTVVQLLSATIITPWIVKRFLSSSSSSPSSSSSSAEDSGPMRPSPPSSSLSDPSLSAALRIMRGAIPFNCAIHVFNYAFFAAVALSGTKASMVTSVDATWAYLWCVQVPQTVVLSMLRSSVFVCVRLQFAHEASRVQNLTGTAVTVLGSISVMGYAIPSSIVMLSSERLMSVLLGTTADASHQWAVISGAVSVSVGIALMALVTLPSLRRLERVRGGLVGV